MPSKNSRKLSKKALESMIRVNHAGEYGALRLYEGQLAVLGESSVAPELEHMLKQEKEHLKAFEAELKSSQLPPTFLQPLWDKAAFVLGVGTAFLGKKAAMACTVAVEEAIDEHYRQQLALLEQDGSQTAFRELVQRCHEEELDHKNIGLEKGAEQTAGYVPMKVAIKTACKAAIWLSKRV